jgi:hypothetical protein
MKAGHEVAPATALFVVSSFSYIALAAFSEYIRDSTRNHQAISMLLTTTRSNGMLVLRTILARSRPADSRGCQTLSSRVAIRVCLFALQI